MTKVVVLGGPAILSFIPTGSGPTVVVKDGVQVAVPTTVVQIGTTGVYNATFSPDQTGTFSVFALGTKVGDVEVVDRTVFDYLRNLEEEALGGWEWDKTAKEITLYRRDGTSMGSYAISDSLEAAYRRPL